MALCCAPSRGPLWGRAAPLRYCVAVGCNELVPTGVYVLPLREYLRVLLHIAPVRAIGHLRFSAVPDWRPALAVNFA